MHEGNLIYGRDGKLWIVDFGIMGRIGHKERRYLAEILYGFLRRDYRRVAEVHQEAGYVPDKFTVDEFAQALRAIGEPIFGKTADGISMSRLLLQLFDVTHLFGMHLRPELVLLQKTMVQVEGVSRALDPQHDMWTASRPIVERWVKRELGPEAVAKRGIDEAAVGLPSAAAFAADPGRGRSRRPQGLHRSAARGAAMVSDAGLLDRHAGRGRAGLGADLAAAGAIAGARPCPDAGRAGANGAAASPARHGGARHRADDQSGDRAAHSAIAAGYRHNHRDHNRRRAMSKRVLLIIGGGIAAYKSLELIRLLAKEGVKTRAVLTKAGSEFVTPLAVGALTQDKVYQDLFNLTDENEMGHIELSRSADLVVVAPATANLMARAANGIADDLASTTLLATDKPVLMAPAMNVRMWLHAATQRSLAQLKADGVAFIGPDDGEMACGEYGPGRMAEPEAIRDAILALLERGSAKRAARRLSPPVRRWRRSIRCGFSPTAPAASKATPSPAHWPGLARR